MILKHEIKFTERGLLPDEYLWLKGELRAKYQSRFNFFLSVGNMILVDESNQLKVIWLGGQGGKLFDRDDYLPDGIAIVHNATVFYMEFYDQISDTLKPDGTPCDTHEFTICLATPDKNDLVSEDQQSLLEAFVAAQAVKLNYPSRKYSGRVFEIIVKQTNLKQGYAT